MQIDRIIYPIKTLGPGNRLAIWTIGCSKRCAKCANPELWRGDATRNVDIQWLLRTFVDTIEGGRVDGVTITGGDPLEQIDELNELIALLRDITDDVLVYTGYTLEEAQEAVGQERFKRLVSQTSVLIDGLYIDELNDGKCVLRGSSNQNIIYFDEAKRQVYSDYMKSGRTIQNVFYDNRMISVGIHNKGS